MVRRTPQSRQRDPERTKERILAAATAEFAAKGYAGARVGEIADRAGVNKQLISYYFGGKEGLYREITQSWLDGQEAAAPVQRRMDLATLAASFIARDPTQRAHTRLIAWDGLTGGGDDPGEPVRTARMKAAVDDLERRQRAGEIPEDLDVRCLLLVAMAGAAAPVWAPQMVRSIFGDETDPDSDAFLEQYADQYADLISRLTSPPSDH